MIEGLVRTRNNIERILAIAVVAGSTAIFSSSCSSQESHRNPEIAFREAVEGIVPKSKGGDGGTKSIAMLKSFPELFPDSIDALLVTANMCTIDEQNRDFAMGIKLYDKILSRDPRNVAAYVNKGAALYLRALPKTRTQAIDIGLYRPQPEEFVEGMREAIKCFESALMISPKDFAANYNKAMAHRMINEPKEAITYFLKAAEASFKTMSMLGTIPRLNEEGNITVVAEPGGICVISAFYRHIIDNYLTEYIQGNRIVTCGPTETYISSENDALAFCYYNLGSSYSHDPVTDVDLCLKYLGKAIELNPKVYQFYKLRSMVHLLTEHFNEADEDMRSAEKVIGEINRLRLEKYQKPTF